jgi:hypothetical protein
MQKNDELDFIFLKGVAVDVLLDLSAGLISSDKSHKKFVDLLYIIFY